MVAKALDKAKKLFVHLLFGGLSMIPFADIDVLSLSSLISKIQVFSLWFVSELLPMRHFPALSTWKKETQ